MEPIDYLPNGTPLYFHFARGEGKPSLAFDKYKAALEKRQSDIHSFLYNDLVETSRRLMEHSTYASSEPLYFYVGGTGMADESAIDAWKNTEIIVVTRDGQKWLRGKRID